MWRMRAFLGLVTLILLLAPAARGQENAPQNADGPNLDTALLVDPARSLDLEQILATDPADFRPLRTDHRPLPDDGMSGLDNVIPLDLAAGEPALVHVRLTRAALGYGVWFGSMAILMVIQLIFFYFDRKPYYLLLALATFMAALVHTATQGLSRAFLFPAGGDGNDMFVAITIWLGLVASGLAAMSILDLRQSAPRLYLIFLGGVAIGGVGVVFGLFGGQLLFAPVGNWVVIVLAALGAWHGVRTANVDGVATRLRAAAYVVLWLGVMATMTQRSATFDVPAWVTHAYAIACVIQTILLTAALGVRLRKAETLSRVMRDEALVAAQEAGQKASALLAERTRELASARQMAEDALRAELVSQQQQVRFMEVISHQYRTPLAAIRTHADNIGLSLPEDDEANRNRLDRVRRGIVRLVEVLEVNLARSRLQGPAFRPSLVSMSIAEIVTGAAARGHDLLQKQIVSELAPEAAQARVMADGDMLGIAIINLLENAVKFSTRSNTAPVTLACHAVDGEAIISVKDSGIGIPPDEIGGIFASAARGSNAADVEGSGIGLSLVARIVAVHHGSVSAESVPGQGTTITMRLPLRQD
jgi:signal transduction histidine kinase